MRVLIVICSLASPPEQQSMLWLASDLAVPASPYLDAYADMRPVQALALDPAISGVAAQDLLPAFALEETGASSRPSSLHRAAQSLHSTPAVAHSLKPPTRPVIHNTGTLPPALAAAALARMAAKTREVKASAQETAPRKAGALSAARTQSLSAARRTIHLGEKFRRAGGGPTSDATAALAARDPHEAEREAAVQRLTLKHASLQVRFPPGLRRLFCKTSLLCTLERTATRSCAFLSRC